MIFDGGPLPSKQKTESDRESSRAEKKKQAMEAMKAGDMQLAQKKFGEAIDVTPQMALRLFKVLREKYNIECIISPYEADAQLAYLSKIGYVDLIITEDSDLLAFGAKRVFYKMDHNGNGKEIELDDIKTIRGDIPTDIWSENLFLCSCILAGCDYLSSIKGVGFKKAYRMMGEMRSYRNVIKNMKLDGKYVVPYDYEEKFEKAFLTFRFQRVFCPIKKCLVTLNDINEKAFNEKKEYLMNNFAETSADIDALVKINLLSKVLDHGDLEFVGPDMSVELAQNIAYGVIDPISKRPYLLESNSGISQALNSWNSDELNSSNTTVSITKAAVMSQGGLLEEEFANKISSLTQYHQQDKARFYKVAKPKLISTKVDGSQKNIKEFFLKNKSTSMDVKGSVSTKIRSFFKNKKPQNGENLERPEEQLAPFVPPEEDEMDQKYQKDNEGMQDERQRRAQEMINELEERSKSMLKVWKGVSEGNKIDIENQGEAGRQINNHEGRQEAVDNSTRDDSNSRSHSHSQIQGISQQVKPLSSIIQRKNSLSNDYDLYAVNNSNCLFKNSKSVNKAFKPPGAPRKNGEEGSTDDERSNLKRKIQDVVGNFNDFAFKRVKKNESVTVGKAHDLRGEQQQQKQRQMIDLNRPPTVYKTNFNINLTSGLDNFSFKTVKKIDRKEMEEEKVGEKRTVYKINLNTSISNENINVDMQSLFNISEYQENRIKNFFRFDRIEKIDLQRTLKEGMGHEIKVDERLFDTNLDYKITDFMTRF